MAVTIEEVWKPALAAGGSEGGMVVELSVVVTNHGRHPVHVTVMGIRDEPQTGGHDDRLNRDVRELAPFGGQDRFSPIVLREEGIAGRHLAFVGYAELSTEELPFESGVWTPIAPPD